MALHDLASNATRYGASSGEGGVRIEITADNETFRLVRARRAQTSAACHARFWL